MGLADGAEGRCLRNNECSAAGLVRRESTGVVESCRPVTDAAGFSVRVVLRADVNVDWKLNANAAARKLFTLQHMNNG